MNFYDAMQEVLKSDRYDFLLERRVDYSEVVNDRVEQFLRSLLESFSFEMPFSLDGNVRIVAAVFFVVAILVAVVAAYIFIRTRLNSRKIVVRHALEDIFEEMRHHTVAELLELGNCENRRIAVRYKYIAVILSLNEKNIIEIKPSATNAVILKQIKATSPEFVSPFSQITENFHYTWFGHKILSDENFYIFNTAVHRVINHA